MTNKASVKRAICCAVVFAGCFSGSGGDGGAGAGSGGAGSGGAAGLVFGGNGGSGAGSGGGTGGTSAIGGAGGVGGTGGSGTGGAGGTGGSGGEGGAGTGGMTAPLAPTEIPESARACTSDDDCVLAAVAGTCCGGCQEAFVKDWVEQEPCVVADGDAAPPAGCQPTECSGGCPGYACPETFGAACVGGKCGVITAYGPCETNADCVLAIDYGPGSSNGCCDCPQMFPQVLVDKEECIVPDGESAPSGCVPDPAICEHTSCPATPAECDRPATLTCNNGSCVRG